MRLQMEAEVEAEAEAGQESKADLEVMVDPSTQTRKAQQLLGGEAQDHQVAPFAGRRIGASSETAPTPIPVAPQKLPHALRSVRAVLH